MKKIIILVLVLTLCLLALCSCNGKANECKDCQATISQKFTINDRFQIGRHIKNVPLTMEAVINVPKDADSHRGTIIGNDDMWCRCITYTIGENGHPHVFFKNINVHKTGTEYIFDEVDVRLGEAVHLAITIDFEARNMLCYLNGELAQAVSDIEITENYELKRNLLIAGDYRGANMEYFKDEIYSVSIWSDIRTNEEIKNDKESIDYTDVDLLASYDFTKCQNHSLKDNSQNKNDLRYQKLWQSKDEVFEPEDYAYSFAIIGDTQELSEKFPDKMASLYDWLVENKEEKKISCVIGLGDITQKSYASEWEYAKAQIFKLNGKIPYTLVRGNHDKLADFNSAFKNTEYENELNGVMEKGKVANAYKLLTVGNNDYLILTLAHGPTDDALNWVSGIIEAYPNHRVIVTTHCYLFRDGTTLDANDAYPASRNNGEDIWNKLVKKHANIELVISGHDQSQEIVYTTRIGDNGNTVHQMLIDPQNTDFYMGGAAMVAMFYFSADGNTLIVRYYSVANDNYGSESSQFTINFAHD